MLSYLSNTWLALTCIPLVIKTTVFHVLGISATSQKWDLQIALTVTLLRKLLLDGPPRTISEQQAMFMKDAGIDKKTWASKVVFEAPPEDALRQLLSQLLTASSKGPSDDYREPELEPVSGEWIGYRNDDAPDTPKSEQEESEREKYDHLAAQAQSNVTVLYFHGGSLYLMDPISTRPVAAKMASLCKGPVFSLRYRLAPQKPFPSALLDGLIAYMSMLYPPPGSFHEAIPASSIVLAGDSAGGNLCMSLLQLMLSAHRASPSETPRVMFHGRLREIPLPAGITLGSASLDLTRSLRGEGADLYDYLQPPPYSPVISPPCDVWPTIPRRPDLYTEGSLLSHPFVSPMAAPSWKGAPPILFCCGEEYVADENKVVAQKAARQGVQVVWEQYEAMPHCFPLLFAHAGVSKAAFEQWSKFVDMAVNNSSGIETSGVFVTIKDVKKQSVDVKELQELNDAETDERMEKARLEIVARYG
ncbi:hypothetical protein Golomagni_06051 [Golovinomyces magnicellulatus]|nr:hypothetical protein Golomagni_06051 [Golovinomyces magnicellulatus]